jgi:TolA-binding protein
VKLLKSHGLLLLLAFLAAVSPAAAAQTDVTTADIQRLQDSIYDTSRDIAQIRSRDSALASQLQSELDDVRDDVTYLKVKVRKREPLARGEYADVRDRIENIRSRARGDASGAYSTPGSSRSTWEDRPSGTVRTQNPNEVPVGTEFDVRLQRLFADLNAHCSEQQD